MSELYNPKTEPPNIGKIRENEFFIPFYQRGYVSGVIESR